MPKHDIPDGHDADSNLIDFRDYLRRRGDPTVRPGSDPTPEADRDAYRYAEYGDGKRVRLSRYDLIWVAMALVIGWIIWVAVTSRG